jgi:exodeoxyribonuclease III
MMSSPSKQSATLASPSKQRPQREHLHIVSWNVASWATTLVKIKQKHGSFDNWLRKHNIDILCIQEVKITCNEISNKAKDLCASELAGYESFWAYPTTGNGTSGSGPAGRTTSYGGGSSSSGQGAGLNGVATFARTGFTARASARALRSDILDNEGRCLMTDHGSFVIFNVYVPNSGDRCKRFPFKLKFLRALEAAASIEKARGKQVILAGDFNIAARTCDVTRYYRLINMHSLIQDHHFEVDMDAFNSIYRNNANTSTNTTNNHIVEHNYDYTNYLKYNHLTPYPLVHNKHTNTYFAPAMDRYLTATEVSELRDAVLYMRTVWPTVERALHNSVRNEEEGGKWRVVADRPVDGKPVMSVRVSACLCVCVCVCSFMCSFLRETQFNVCLLRANRERLED